MGHAEQCYLAGDIGGTKTNLALFESVAGIRRPVHEQTLPSGDYRTLEELVEAFFTTSGRRARYAAFGVAGPVVNGTAKITNLPWELSESRITRNLGLESTTLVNDLVAVASSVPVLREDDVHTIAPAPKTPHSPIAVVAPGTGLGEAYLVPQVCSEEGGTPAGAERSSESPPPTFRAWPSEGGHADFAPLDDEQLALLQYMQQRIGHVSYERVCSGTGIANIYAFLRDTGRAAPAPELDAVVRESDQPARAILDRALDDAEPPEVCTKTAELFARILAAEAANFALKVLPFGGLYLAGGIPPRMLPILQQPMFMEQFRAKGRFADLAAQFPVYVIMNTKAALFGAAQLCEEERRRYDAA